MKKILIIFVLLLSISLISCSDGDRYIRVMKNNGVDGVIALADFENTFDHSLLLSFFFEVDYSQDIDNMNIDVVFGYSEAEKTYTYLFVPEKLRYSPIVEEISYISIEELAEAVTTYNFEKIYGEIVLSEKYPNELSFPIYNPYSYGLHIGSHLKPAITPFTLVVGTIEYDDVVLDVHLIKNIDDYYTLFTYTSDEEDRTPLILYEFMH